MISYPFDNERQRWEQVSNKYHQKFIDSGKQPDPIIQFINEHPFALKAPWVENEFMRWMLNRRTDLLRKCCFVDKGKRAKATPFFIAKTNWAIVDLVNEELRQSKTEEAFKAVSKREIFRTSYGWTTIRDRYYATLKAPPQVCVTENDDGVTIEVLPGKIAYGPRGQILTFFYPFASAPIEPGPWKNYYGMLQMTVGSSTGLKITYKDAYELIT